MRVLRPTPALDCFCGRSYSTSSDLGEHRTARGHFPAHRCTESCKHPAADLHDGQIRECGCCGKRCERLDIFQDHVVATGHCFCADCDITFSSRQSWDIHRRTAGHASEFKCCDCNLSFKDVHALVAHMESRVHRKPLQPKVAQKRDEASLVASTDTECTRCRRRFPSSQSLQQHYASVKHKPLSDLRCPIGTDCPRVFTSPSALLHHLESGKCPSGINRDEVYQMVASCDPGEIIHTQSVSVADTLSGLEASMRDELEVLSSTTGCGWSLLTPNSSQGSVEDSLEQWSLLEGSQTQFEETMSFTGTTLHKLQCPICPKKRNTFPTPLSLQQHVDSPVHSPKVYRCPSSLSDALLNQTTCRKKHNAKFATLSGLCQHIESGSCQDSRRSFFRCLGLIQGHLEQLGFQKMHLMLPDAQA